MGDGVWNIWSQLGFVCIFIILAGITALLIDLWRNTPSRKIIQYMQQLQQRVDSQWKQMRQHDPRNNSTSNDGNRKINRRSAPSPSPSAAYDDDNMSDAALRERSPDLETLKETLEERLSEPGEISWERDKDVLLETETLKDRPSESQKASERNEELLLKTETETLKEWPPESQKASERDEELLSRTETKTLKEWLSESQKASEGDEDLLSEPVRGDMYSSLTPNERSTRNAPIDELLEGGERNKRSTAGVETEPKRKNKRVRS